MRRARGIFPQPVAQVGFDKAIQVAVQHSLGVPGFVVSAVVFHHLVGMEHVRADLAAPLSFGVFAAQDRPIAPLALAA